MNHLRNLMIAVALVAAGCVTPTDVTDDATGGKDASATGGTPVVPVGGSPGDGGDDGREGRGGTDEGEGRGGTDEDEGRGGTDEGEGGTGGVGGVEEPPPPRACEQGPGRTTMHRLNRAEYNNTIEAIFGVDYDPAANFPSDPVNSGFDNNADQLTINGGQAEKYIDAASAVVDQVLADDPARILLCDPANDGHDACVDRIITQLGPRIFRRPITAEEVARATRVVTEGEAAGDTFTDSVATAVTAMLVSPNFLFRVIERRGDAGEVAALSDYELASRLSYFLWRAPPDDALYAAAAAGALSQPGGLSGHVERMLRDPRGYALVDGFVAQWLDLARLEGAAPDPALFPEFSEALRDAMRAETLDFAAHVFSADTSPMDFVDANYTIGGDEVARLYGAELPGADSARIDLRGFDRAGVLSHASVLTMNSNSTETSVIRRGVWVLHRILCTPIGAPPDVADLVLPERRGDETLRERLARHRSDASCAGCHQLIDPIGFGFEGYDPLGRDRANDAFGPVDNLGALPDGREFVGARDLADALQDDRSFRACFSKKLITYAMGRDPAYDQECLVNDMAQAITADSQVSELIGHLVESGTFRTQRNEDGE